MSEFCPAAHWLSREEIGAIAHRVVATRYFWHDAVTGWWYFWDESQSDLSGPYPDKSAVERAIRAYGESL